MSNLRVLIAGGGTGGHIIPALAVARELVARHAAEVLFIGTARGMEMRLVPEAGFNLRLVNVGQLKNVSLLTRLRTLTDLPRAIFTCQRLIREFNPGVVFGVGGYASGPAMASALLLGIPSMAFEPNAVPGASRPPPSTFSRRRAGSETPRSPAFPFARSFSPSPLPPPAPRRTCWSSAARRARASSILSCPRSFPGCWMQSPDSPFSTRAGRATSSRPWPPTPPAAPIPTVGR